MLTEKLLESSEIKNADPVQVLYEKERNLNTKIIKLNKLQRYNNGQYAKDLK